jgi:hypothetical protein
MKNATASMPVTDFVGPPMKLETDEAPIINAVHRRARANPQASLVPCSRHR